MQRQSDHGRVPPAPSEPVERESADSYGQVPWGRPGTEQAGRPHTARHLGGCERVPTGMDTPD